MAISLLLLGALALLFAGRQLHMAKQTLPRPPKAHAVAKPALALKSFTFPAGGRTLFPAYRLVALYGTPDKPVLGALGEQSLPDTIQRAKDVAQSYQPYSKERIYPALEIITTIASASPTDNGDYSQELDAAQIQPWIDAAHQNGLYVVLDLQPGRSDFLRQAKEYQSLLEQPNVGLALDPEWRLGPSQLPLGQVGSVSIDEINATTDWLAVLTAQKQLPQKLVVLHEFRLSMLPDRQNLNTSHPQLAYVIQMDGQGAQQAKLDTWHAVTATPPPNVQFGWKNFYAKDTPVLPPQATMQLSPQPWYISHQ
jgi:hypothetical protein